MIECSTSHIIWQKSVKCINKDRIWFPHVQTIHLTSIKAFIKFVSLLNNYGHFRHKCHKWQKWQLFWTKRQNFKNTFMGVKWIVWTWGKQILSLYTHLNHFLPNKIRYTAPKQKIIGILRIFSENKLYPGQKDNNKIVFDQLSIPFNLIMSD